LSELAPSNNESVFAVGDTLGRQKGADLYTGKRPRTDALESPPHNFTASQVKGIAACEAVE
jgi:hypothetical protein